MLWTSKKTLSCPSRSAAIEILPAMRVVLPPKLMKTPPGIPMSTCVSLPNFPAVSPDPANLVPFSIASAADACRNDGRLSSA